MEAQATGRIKRIIFLVDNPFTLRDYNRFGVEVLLNNGFKVEVWEVTPVLYPHVHEGFVRDPDFRYEGHVLFEDKKRLFEAISGLEETDFVITFISYYFRSLKLYRAVGKSKALYATSTVTVMPRVGQGRAGSFLKKLWILLKAHPFRTPVELVFQRVPPGLLRVRSADYLIAGGGKTLGFKDKGPSGAGAEVIYAHAFDYDRYLDTIKRPVERPEVERYAVFLDENLPFHHDFIMTGDMYADYADVYYPALRRFFGLVEKETGLEVVVAAHPSSRYEGGPDYFGGRRVIKGKTPELVRDASLVILHCSNALNFAVLFRRPLLFATNSVYEGRYEGMLIKELARMFGAPYFNIEKELPVKVDIPAVDEEAYARYAAGYIKAPGTPELPSWQIVADRLKKV